MELEVVGPRVSVDRDGTGDRGGGQLVVKQSKLLVRTHSMERLIGALPSIDHIQILDLAHLQSTVHFIDGQVWNVQSEEGEDLTAFYKQVESFAGRPGLLRDPPRLSDFVRAAATPSRVRVALWWAFAFAVVVGSWMAFASASERAVQEAQAAKAQAEATERAQAAAGIQRAEASKHKAEADAVAEQLLEAVRTGRVRDAKGLYDRLEAVLPGHAVAKQTWPQLQSALVELDERERVEGIARGVSQARALASDPLACEAAKRVADSYALLKRAQPSDADYEAARRVLGDLERCRQRVIARFAQSAEDSRRSMRVLAVNQIDSAVRRLGYSAKVTLSGPKANTLRIEARELDEAAAERILALTEPSHATFAAARTDEGFARIEIRGEKLKRDVALDPPSPQAIIVPVLKSFGLASPLTLE